MLLIDYFIWLVHIDWFHYWSPFDFIIDSIMILITIRLLIWLWFWSLVICYIWLLYGHWLMALSDYWALINLITVQFDYCSVWLLFNLITVQFDYCSICCWICLLNILLSDHFLLIRCFYWLIFYFSLRDAADGNHSARSAANAQPQ